MLTSGCVASIRDANTLVCGTAGGAASAGGFPPDGCASDLATCRDRVQYCFALVEATSSHLSVDPMPLLRGLRPTSVQRSAASGASSVTLVRPKLAAEPDALAAKADDARPAEPLPAEAQRLKELLLRQRSRLHRFSLSRMRKVVVPPVEIPPPLDVPGGLAYLVSGVKIPMTLDMFLRHRKRLLRHLPARIDEAAAY